MIARTSTSWAVIALAALLGGCTVGPNYKRPAIVTPVTYRGATDGGEGDPLGARKWNTVFTDPVLQGLIAEALKNNYDVKIAADRVLEQQAQVGITRSAQFPTLSAGASYDSLALPGGLIGGSPTANTSSVGVTTSSNGHSYINSGGFSLSTSYNLDFWGYYRRQTEAARAQLRATQWAQQVTFSTLVDNVATGYYELRTLDAELEITRKTLRDRGQSLDLTRTLEQGGSGKLGDVREAEQLYYTAESQIPDLQRQIEQQENNLNLLLGRAPGTVARGGEISDVAHPVDIPVGLPSALLERRPDVLRTEELLVQANANIGVARAQFFPTISLTGSGGISSDALKGLVESRNFYYYAIGSLAQPIFEGGKLRSNLKLAQATDQELLDTYQQTIAGALRDVSNALSAYQRTREYREKQEKLVAAAEDAVRLAKMLYFAGATSYLEVLTNETNLFTAQLSLKTAQQQEALSLVQLYNALGGGW